MDRIVAHPRTLPVLLAAMVTLMTAGLAGAFASGFGVAVPVGAIAAALGTGSLAMLALIATLARLQAMDRGA